MERHPQPVHRPPEKSAHRAAHALQDDGYRGVFLGARGVRIRSGPVCILVGVQTLVFGNGGGEGGSGVGGLVRAGAIAVKHLASWKVQNNGFSPRRGLLFVATFPFVVC